jgi:microcystin-dependent protein
MSDPFVGEIRMFAGNFAPAGWAFCDGQALLIADNDTLFQLIGTTYGGDGQTTFNLPDLRGRVPIHQGSNAGTNFVLGQVGGTEAETLTVNQMPAHGHLAGCSSLPGDSIAPSGAVWAQAALALYLAVVPDVDLAASAVALAGGSQQHDNMAPYLGVSFILSLLGFFPQQ